MWLWLTLTQTTAWLGLALLAGRRPEARPARAHAVLLAGLVGAALTPALTALALGLGLGLFVGPGAPARYAAVAPVAAPPADAPASATERAAAALAALALAGAAARLASLAVRWRRGERLCDGEPVADPGLAAALGRAARGLGLRAPALVRSPSAPGPLVWAAGPRPRVVIPGGLNPGDVSAEGWEGVLRHELAHVRRWDGYAAVAAGAAAALLWWHPLAWAVRSRRELAAEFACDDWALADGRCPADYADAVLALTPGPRVRVPAGAEALAGRAVAARLRRALTRAAPPPPEAGRRWSVGLVLAASTLAGLLALSHARPGPPERIPALPAPHAAPPRGPGG